MKNLALIGALAVALTACGSGSSDSGDTAGGSTGGAMLDAFTSYVAGLVGSAPDDTEPTSIDSVSVTTSDNAEPSPVM